MCGFTLLELLVTIGILLLLCTCVLTIRDHGISRERFIITKSEMSAIASALERYKDIYGDYPKISAHNDFQGNILKSALDGCIDPNGNDVSDGDRLYISSLRCSDDGVYFLDGFGKKYIYYYKLRGHESDWLRQSYILLSTGMKGMDASTQYTSPDTVVSIDGGIGSTHGSDLIITNAGFL